jgi:hypothetical protein
MCMSLVRKRNAKSTELIHYNSLHINPGLNRPCRPARGHRGLLLGMRLGLRKPGDYKRISFDELAVSERLQKGWFLYGWF